MEARREGNVSMGIRSECVKFLVGYIMGCFRYG